VSEVSSIHDDEYEPTVARSPGSVGFISPPTKETLLDTSPLSRAGDIDIEMQAHASYIITKPSFEIGDDPTPIATTSHNPLTSPPVSPDPHSPHPSYYSASDIPAPSPLPETVYRYTTGEIASSPPTRTASLYTVRDDAGSSPTRSTAPRLFHDLTTAQQNRGSSAASSPGVYEMRVRSPPHDPSEHHLAPTPLPDRLDLSRGASEATDSTAYDSQQEWLADGAHGQYRLSGLDDDQATIIHDDRLSGVHNHDRPVSGSSWDGGLAL